MDWDLIREQEHQAALREQDVLIPYRKMYEREEVNLETHAGAMATLDEGSKEWLWRKELARRAHERSIIWNRLYVASLNST